MRGKLVPAAENDSMPGITPAGAGKTEYKLMVEVQAQDHPRRCGENPSVHRLHVPSVGSPPQVRGKRMKDAEKDGYLGITPAGAGKTPCVAVTLYTFRDHPRRCGENLQILLPLLAV